MKAIYKKELKSYLTSMTGAVFIAFLLLIVGIYFLACNLNYAYPYFGYALSSSSFVFLIIVPILTMRVMAEEKKQKTDQMLYTSPVSIKGVVLGKYFALITVLAVPMILFCLYPLILSMFGTINYPMAYLGILGFFLMGAVFLAIGMFISSLTESQVIAAVLSFIVLFVCYMMKGISGFISGTAIASYIGLLILVIILGVLFYTMTNHALITAGLTIFIEVVITILYLSNSSIFENALPNVLNTFNLADKFSNMAAGIFDVTGIVYYITICGLFLFLTVQSVQKRRYS